MRIRSENSLCRLWDFERPRPQIPIPRHRKVFVVMCCCVYKEPGRGARALWGSSHQYMGKDVPHKAQQAAPPRRLLTG